MRYWFAAILAAAATCAVVLAQAAALEPWEIAAAKGIKEATDAREVFWSQAGSLWITADENEKDRNGTAAYTCALIVSAGAPSGRLIIIHVWETASMLAGSPREIGRYDCRT